MNSDDRTMQQIKEESKWSKEELEQLAKAKASDPLTWPLRMQRARTQERKYGYLWEQSQLDTLPDWRRMIMLEALRADDHLQNVVIFANEAVRALRSTVERGSTEWHIIDNLDGEAPYHLLSLVAEACLELVPRLNQAMPIFDPKDILAAVLKDA